MLVSNQVFALTHPPVAIRQMSGSNFNCIKDPYALLVNFDIRTNLPTGGLANLAKQNRLQFTPPPGKLTAVVLCKLCHVNLRGRDPWRLMGSAAPCLTSSRSSSISWPPTRNPASTRMTSRNRIHGHGSDGFDISMTSPRVGPSFW
jgi:hypothetical protein